VDGLITFIAQYLILVPVIVNAYIFIKLRKNQRFEMVVLLFCSGFISILLAKVGAHLFNDQRPYISDGTAPLFPHSGDPNGFPSDHTLLSALLAFTALYYSRPAGIFLLVVAAFIGVARVAAHVHHAVDIIGSFVITGIAYLIVIYLIKNRSAARMLNMPTPKEKS
jgi:membrane-associated phospholipid phosphatase